jgi:hypothetical protein
MRILLELDLDGDRVRSEVLERIESGPEPGGIRRRRGRTMRGWSPRPTWQHRVERVANGDELTAESLDAIGAEGWELTAVTPARDGLVLVFKRQCGPLG